MAGTNESLIQVTNPRITLSTLIMGAGVIASIVFNYAAYGTRIAVLESNAIMQEKATAQLTEQLTTSIDLLHTIHVKTEADKRDILFLQQQLTRLKSDLNDLYRQKKEN